MKTINDVTAGVRNLARLYDHQIEAETIAFYAQVLLRRMTPDEACRAIGVWAERETRWPSPGSIIAIVHPKSEQRDEAAELAQRLRAAIARRGYTWESTYRYDGHESIEAAIECELGEDALRVVQRSGGWAAFCKEWGGEVGDTTARAQLRGICEAIGKGAGMSRQAIAGASRNQLVFAEPDTEPET